MRPVMTATQVTQQVSGLLVSSSMSLRQQHKHTTYTARTSRLTPRPTAPTHARIIKDWHRSVERRKKVPEKQRCHLLKSWLRCDFTLKNMSRAFQQTASANIKRVKEYVWSENVRLADPQHPKGRLTAHQYQTTLVCRDISKVEFSHLTYIISINTTDCCMQQRELQKLGKCCSQITL